MRCLLSMLVVTSFAFMSCSSIDDNCVGGYCFDDYEPCGDGVCQTDEDCPEDCAGVFCGNFICDPLWGEDEENCPSDCGRWCGDGICNGNENQYTCDYDCGRGPLCGDNVCEPPRENDENCFEDCGCWNGVCDSDLGETELTCYQDCGECGNGVCSGPEDHWFCPEDCRRPVECGDLICDPGENPEECPGDCYCGCSLCNEEDAPADCTCHYNTCDPGESAETCPTDCAPTCGDGYCDESIGESWLYCPVDCSCTDSDFPIDCEDGEGCWPRGTNCLSDVFQCDGAPNRCGWIDCRANCCEGIFKSCPETTPYYCSDSDTCMNYSEWQTCPSKDFCTSVNLPCERM